MNPDDPKPRPEWPMHILAWMAGIAIIYILLGTMAWWSAFHVLGD